MKLIYLCLAFLILLASASFARGLEIFDIRVSVNYDQAYVYRLENKEKVNYVFGLLNNSRINADVLPGSNITFTLRLANTLQAGFGNEIRDAFARIRIKEIDDGSDLEETSTNIDLDAENDDLVDVNFGIPVDANAGTYNVIIEGEGEDRNHTIYRTEVNLKLPIKKESHDIRITGYRLNPSIVDCNRKVKITADAINAGSNSEDEVAMEFKSDDLKINSITRDITLESSNDAIVEDKKYTKTLNVEIPNTFKKMAYPILINLYWKNNILFDQKTMYLSVRDCGAEATTEQNQNATNANNNSSNNQTQTSESGQERTPSVSGKFSPSPALIFIVLGGFAIFIILILLIFDYSRKK